jgi:hypothetical protein
MSNKDQYLKLWQQKRSELQVDTNPQADWLAMHHLLDQQMPVANSNAGHTSTGSNLVKQLSHFAKFKLLYIAAALITSAAITYVVTQHRAATKNNKPAKTEVRADSLLNNSTDTTLINDQAADSTLLQDAPTDNTITSETPANAAGNNAGINADLSTDKNGSGKNPTETNGNSATGKNGVINNKSGKQGNSISARNSINGNANNLNRSRHGGSDSRLLSSANKLNNDLALLKNNVNNSKNPGVATRGNSRVTVGNTRQQTDDTRQPQSTNGNDLYKRTDGQSTDIRKDNELQNNSQLLQALPSPFVIRVDSASLLNDYVTAGMANKTQSAKAKSRFGQPIIAKAKKDKTTTNSNLDWGILFGVNTLGSFTPKEQNKNIYGSLPVDAYAGLFAAYNVSTKWAVDAQVKLLIPNSVSGSYNHTFSTRNDTGQIVRQTYKVTDSRKVYSAQLPLHLVYNITNNISVKAGPVINLSIKHFGASSLTASTDTVIDSIGYAGRLADTITRIMLTKKLSLGISGGVRFNYKRLWVETTYYRGSQPYKISSPVGSYSPAVNNLQISLGFKLNKTKPDK